MKEQSKEILARKYGTAFIAVFADSLTYDDIVNIASMADFLSKNKRISFFLTLPALKDEVKEEGLDFLCQKFKVVPSIHKLMTMLLAHKRSFLLEKVLRVVVQLYKKQAKIEAFHITSYPALPSSSLQEVEKFLSQQTGHSIRYSYAVDSQLISGMRMQSSEHLWEHSIEKQLREIQMMRT